MDFWANILKFIDTKMKATPGAYGTFHLVSWGLSILLGVVICLLFRKNKNPERVRRTVLIISAVVLLSEIIKQINYSASFPATGGIVWDFQWYAFPYQFCAMPMYIGVLQGIIKKGKVHNALCAFLATYAIFAGVCVMFYPGDVFTRTFYICVQTMLCHGTMLPVGVYLMYSGHVEVKHKTILKAMPVFAIALSSAMVLNEIMYASGILNGETFNMFFVSRHFPSTLPVYSLIHNSVPFPLNVIIYFCGFSMAAYVILLIGMGIKKLCSHKKKNEQTI